MVVLWPDSTITTFCGLNPKTKPSAAMSVELLTTISPITNQPILTRNGLSDSEVALLPVFATQAFDVYRLTSLGQRQTIVKNALRLLNSRQGVLARELTEQMGRPIAYTSKEITTAVARGEYLLRVSEEALRDTDGEPEKGFKRYIRKAPLGPVLIIFAWNVGSFLSKFQWNFANVWLPVSLLDIDQFLNYSSSRRQFRHSQAFPSDTNSCGTYI